MLEKFTRDIAIDFGTASVLVYVQGQGIVLKEPSVVAIDVSTDRVVKVGQDAMEMLGRTPDHIDALRPMKNGTISQYEVTLQMLRYFIRRACGKVWIPPRVLICVPTGISEVEMRAVMEASREAGARRTYLIEEPKAAAIGAGLDIKSPVGSMVVNIGDVYEHKKTGYMKVTGRSLTEGTQKEVLISSREMIEALYEPITAILDSICSVVEQTPPELVGDILQKGMVLTGGGSLLRGLDKLIERVTGIPAYVAKKPISSTVLGAGSLLPYLSGMPEGVVTLPSRVKS